MSTWLDRVKFGNGKSGSPAVSGTINTYATCTGTSGETSLTTTLSASAGDVILIHQSQGTGAGQWELNQVSADAGATLTLNYPLAYTYGTGAQVVLVPQYTGGAISGNITGTDWNGSIGGIICAMYNGPITDISGTITAPRGFRGASGVGPDNMVDGKQGEGYGSSTYNGTSYNYNFNGGGGADYQVNEAGGGGGGGNGTAGSTAPNSTNAIEGIGGVSCGNAELTSILFGGGGGSGCTGNDDSSQSGAGGAGAGIVILFVNSISAITGSINLNGSNGSNSITGGGQEAGGSGGGAGGSCLIFTKTSTIGTNKITASGGIGGNGYGNGGAGGDGRIRINYYSPISGTTTPTLSSGQDTNLQSQIYGGIL